MVNPTDRVFLIMSRVFGVNQALLDTHSSPDSIPGWDSINHLNLIAGLEEEFGVKIRTEDAMEMADVTCILEVLKKLDHNG